jgi:hypothetical protein
MEIGEISSTKVTQTVKDNLLVGDILVRTVSTQE